MHRASRRAVILLCALGVLPWALQALGPVRVATPFAATIAQLSEAEGTFDTDNLISNERSYLEVVPALAARGVRGGAYIGVGPDQNFSYIARIRPSIAYIIDVRRDNLLLHLLFKALFSLSSTRAEYLSLLTGRAPPDRLDTWSRASIQQIVAHVDRTALPPSALATHRANLARAITAFGVPLAPADLNTIERFHQAFITAGLALRFQTHGRPPRYHYPTFRELLLATDTNGRTWNYLASEEDFQFLRALQARDRVIPVVGNVGGPHALAAIARAIAAQSERVSAFYISNVEFYLVREGLSRRFGQNLALLPRDGRSVMIRSIFGGASSMSTVQPMDKLIAELR
jgi:hypothetical protein